MLYEVITIRLTRSEDDAQDLLQEVLLKALAWLDELEEIEFRKAWLIKVMYNTFIDRPWPRLSVISLAPSVITSYSIHYTKLYEGRSCVWSPARTQISMRTCI